MFCLLYNSCPIEQTRTECLFLFPVPTDHRHHRLVVLAAAHIFHFTFQFILKPFLMLPWYVVLRVGKIAMCLEFKLSYTLLYVLIHNLTKYTKRVRKNDGLQEIEV